MGSGSVKWGRIGDYIEWCDERNTDERNTAGRNYPVIGINRDKTFMPTVANLDGVDIRACRLNFPIKSSDWRCRFSGTLRLLAIKRQSHEIAEKRLLSDADRPLIS